MEIEDLTPHPVGSPTKKAKFGSSQHSDAFSMKRQRVFPDAPNSLITKTQSYFITLPMGLEAIAEEEIREKLNPSVVKKIDRNGKVFFATEKPIAEILQLKSAEQLYAFVAELSGIPSDEKGLEYLQKVPLQIDWQPALYLWRNSPLTQREPTSSNSSGSVEVSPEVVHFQPMETEENRTGLKISSATFPNKTASLSLTVPAEHSMEVSPPVVSTFVLDIEPIFRVTGHRTGDQTYKSPQLAGCIGAGLIKRYGWKVDLKQYNMEVCADLNGDTLVLGIALSPLPLYQTRYQGHVSLKPCVAYCMARLAKIQPGDVIVDPMVASGMILSETSQNFPNGCYFGGDISKDVVERISQKTKEFSKNIQLTQWNVAKLPLRSKSVDVTLCVIPFGKKVGNFKVNHKLYPLLFRELTRVTCPGGRAILMTLEKELMKKIMTDNLFWTEVTTLSVDLGGLELGLYVLHRTHHVLKE